MINREISSLYQPFGKLVTNFLARWNKASKSYPAQVFEGYRPFERQAALYAQGRTIPGPKVTNAMPGFSWHQYGLAVDVVFDADPVKPGAQWTWDGKLPWPVLGKMGEVDFGLEWAGAWRSFPEFPHFQRTWGMQLTEARELYEIGGLDAVWKSLDLTLQALGAKK